MLTLFKGFRQLAVCVCSASKGRILRLRCDVPQKLNSEDISYEIRRRTASPEEDGKEMRELGSLERCFLSCLSGAALMDSSYSSLSQACCCEKCEASMNY